MTTFVFKKTNSSFPAIRVLSILDWHLIPSHLETWSGLPKLQIYYEVQKFQSSMKLQSIISPTKLRAVAALGFSRTLLPRRCTQVSWVRSRWHCTTRKVFLRHGISSQWPVYVPRLTPEEAVHQSTRVRPWRQQGG